MRDVQIGGILGPNSYVPSRFATPVIRSVMCYHPRLKEKVANPQHRTFLKLIDMQSGDKWQI
jgi:hypothetical protein